jgi:putative acetyltransferase
MEDYTGVQIRRADHSDSIGISKVLRESFAEYRHLYTSEAYDATTPSDDGVIERMSEGPVWVAVLGSRLIGTISVVSKKEGLYLRGMAVLPEYRGHNIGWELLEFITEYAIRGKIKRLFLSTTPFLSRAISLYERFGFRRIDDGPFDLLGTQLFTMEKLL